MRHYSYVLLCTETILSKHPVVLPRSSCDVHLLRSVWPRTLGGSAWVCNLTPFSFENSCNFGGTTQQLFKLTWKLLGLIVDSSNNWKKTSVSKSQRPKVLTSFWSFSVRELHRFNIFWENSCLSGLVLGSVDSSASSLTEWAPIPIDSMP